jgi:hypothetical protein
MTDDPQAFKSEKYNREGEFLLSLSADDYVVVMHALVVAGTARRVEHGDVAAAPYDGLYDRLMDWNHCDLEPYIESD